MSAPKARQRRPRWAVLISGRGSNLAAVLEWRDEIDVRLVLSSRAEAWGLLRARRAGGVPAEVMPLQKGTKKIDWPATIRRIAESGATHVLLAGFMRLVPVELINRFSPGRIVNLHPSLLPAYPGLKSIERAYFDGAELGCTVHEVIEEVDAGRVLCQRRTLRREDVSRYELVRAEFLLHVDEQRILSEVLRRRFLTEPECARLG